MTGLPSVVGCCHRHRGRFDPLLVNELDEFNEVIKSVMTDLWRGEFRRFRRALLLRRRAVPSIVACQTARLRQPGGRSQGAAAERRGGC